MATKTSEPRIEQIEEGRTFALKRDKFDAVHVREIIVDQKLVKVWIGCPGERSVRLTPRDARGLIQILEEILREK